MGRDSFSVPSLSVRRCGSMITRQQAPFRCGIHSFLHAWLPRPRSSSSPPLVRLFLAFSLSLSLLYVHRQTYGLNFPKIAAIVFGMKPNFLRHLNSCKVRMKRLGVVA